VKEGFTYRGPSGVSTRSTPHESFCNHMNITYTSGNLMLLPEQFKGQNYCTKPDAKGSRTLEISRKFQCQPAGHPGGCSQNGNTNGSRLGCQARNGDCCGLLGKRAKRAILVSLRSLVSLGISAPSSNARQNTSTPRGSPRSLGSQEQAPRDDNGQVRIPEPGCAFSDRSCDRSCAERRLHRFP